MQAVKLALRIFLSALSGFVGIFATPMLFRILRLKETFIVWDRDPDPNPWMTSHFALWFTSYLLVCGVLSYWLLGKIGRLFQKLSLVLFR